jgi:hypothetical protein
VHSVEWEDDYEFGRKRPRCKLRYFPRNCLEDLRKIKKHFSHGSRPPDREANPIPSDYEARGSTIQQQCSECLTSLLCVPCTMFTKWTHMSVCGSAWFNSRTAGRIWVKFGMDVITLQAASNSWFLISYNRKYQHDGRTNLWGGQSTSNNNHILMHPVVLFTN